MVSLLMLDDEERWRDRGPRRDASGVKSVERKTTGNPLDAAARAGCGQLCEAVVGVRRCREKMECSGREILAEESSSWVLGERWLGRW
jgi:hypothetical protein